MSIAPCSREPFILQDRDTVFLRALFESRVMTTSHVSALYFGSKSEAAKKRLQKLKLMELISERRRAVNEPSILFITMKGLSLLKAHGALQEYPPLSQSALEKRSLVSPLTIRHELEVMDIKTAFHLALRGSGRFTIDEFGTWPRLYEFETTMPNRADTVVRPDGFVRILEKTPDGGLSEHFLYLEVDRSTESLDTLVSKAKDYLSYYTSGGFAMRNGAPPSAFKEFPFRVLMVFKSLERRNNMAECLLRTTPPILTQVCLSTIAEVRENPFGRIWVRPVDYRDALTGTPYDQQRKLRQRSYQRQTSREVFVTQNIKAQLLFPARKSE